MDKVAYPAMSMLEGLTLEPSTPAPLTNQTTKLFVGETTVKASSILPQLKPKNICPYFQSGKNHSCAVRPNQTIKCWGDDSSGQSSAGDIKTTAAGNSHNCSIRFDSSIVCWGDNNHNQVSGAPSTYKAVVSGDSHRLCD